MLTKPRVHVSFVIAMLAGLICVGDASCALSQAVAQESGQEKVTDVAPEFDSAAEFLPATTALYAEIAQPEILISRIENHPLVARVMGLEAVTNAMATKEFAALLLGKTFLEQKLGRTVEESLKINLSGGLCVAVDVKTNGVVICGKSSDEAALKRLLGSILNLATMQSGGEAPYEVVDYRNAKAAKFDDFILVRNHVWFVVSNKVDLAKQIADHMTDGPVSPLADQEWFKEAMEHSSKSPFQDARAAIDLKTLRDAGIAKELFIGRTDNPGVELVMGGVLDALKHSNVAAGNLGLNEELDLSVSTPFESGWADEHREFFYGENLTGAAPKPLLPENLVASISSYRDIAGWWLSKEDLFEENVIAQLAQADSQLSTIFSGMDFGQEVLGALQPGVQIIVSENEFDEDYTPDVKLPAFALVGKLKDTKRMQPRLNIAFQSAIGVTNLNLGMNGQPQLSIETERVGEAKISTASYFVDEEEMEGLMLFNFSPSIAFQGEHFIVSSSRHLAVELVELAGKYPDGMLVSGDEEVNTRMKLDGTALERILVANRESLIANSMLEKGHGRAAAEVETDVLLTVASLFRSADIEYAVEEDGMRIDFNLGVKVEDVEEPDTR